MRKQACDVGSTALLPTKGFEAAVFLRGYLTDMVNRAPALEDDVPSLEGHALYMGA